MTIALVGELRKTSARHKQRLVAPWVHREAARNITERLEQMQDSSTPMSQAADEMAYGKSPKMD